jgi:Tol biopolymer transport system component
MRKPAQTALLYSLVCCTTLLVGCTTLRHGALSSAQVVSDAAFTAIVAPPAWIIAGPFVLAEKVGERRDGVTSATFGPDGHDILITYRHGRYQHVYTVTRDGAVCRQLTERRRFDLNPLYSPDKAKIVFSSRRGWLRKRIDLFVMNADGSDLHQLTTVGSVASAARFSPDGRRLVFAAYRRGRQADIFMMNADGTGIRQLTTDEDHEANPLILPDGERLVFWRARWYGHSSPVGASDFHDWDAYTIRVDGTGLTRMTRECIYRLPSVALSPDGKRMVYGIDNPWGIDLFSVSLEDPLSVTEVMPNGAGYWVEDADGRLVTHMCSPCFSPDGGSLLFAMTADPETHYSHGPRELHIMDLRTGEARRLTDLKLHILDAGYSPDGKLILFRVDPEPVQLRGRYELWVMNADGSNAHRTQVAVEK